MTNFRTLGSLNFLPTRENPTGQTASIITPEEYAMSKHAGSYKKIPLSGVQMMEEVIKRIQKHIPDNTGEFGTIYTYRDSYFCPGMLKSQINESTDITNIVFERVIGTVDIISTADNSMRLAMKYQNDDFVEFAIGLNVQVCQNFNIMNSGTRFRTNKRDGVTVETLLDNLEAFIREREQFYNVSLGKMKAMSEFRLSMDNVEEMLGELLISARRPNTVMVGTNEVGAIADQILKAEPKSMWDFLQAGTQVIRFNSSNGASTLDSLENLSKYVHEKAGMNWEEAIIVQ